MKAPLKDNEVFHWPTGPACTNSSHKSSSVIYFKNKRLLQSRNFVIFLNPNTSYKVTHIVLISQLISTKSISSFLVMIYDSQICKCSLRNKTNTRIQPHKYIFALKCSKVLYKYKWEGNKLNMKTLKRMCILIDHDQSFSN